MIPFSGLSRFSGHFGSEGPSPLNQDTTVVEFFNYLLGIDVVAGDVCLR